MVDGTIDGVNDFNWVNEDEFVTALDLDVASDFEELDRWDDDRDCAVMSRPSDGRTGPADAA